MADVSLDVVVEIEPTAKKKQKLKKSSLTAKKCTFVFTCVVIVTLSQGIVAFQWLVPYVYVTLTPLLVTLRIIMYCRKRWHFFLFDFCYYANAFCLLFLCLPDNKIVFSVVYSLSSGPLVSAIPVYRNSLVLHDIDKVTSTYIHILPPLLAYVVRWYPAEVSKYWFKPFMPDMPELSPIWMYLVPFVAFAVHSGLYSLVVNCLCRESDNKVSSYNYLGDKEGSKLYRMFNFFGPRWRCPMFYLWNWIFCLGTLLISLISYYSFIGNCLFLAFFVAMATWNGGSYYVHVFSVRGFVDELE